MAVAISAIPELDEIVLEYFRVLIGIFILHKVAPIVLAQFWPDIYIEVDSNDDTVVLKKLD